MTTYTTNVTRGTTRVKLTAELDRETPRLIWAERYDRGQLTGCGQSLAGLGGDVLHDCQMRLASLFDGSMLWSARPKFDMDEMRSP